jgi:hypothetical protein
MRIHELFEKDVTRNIPPVVYFHEQDPQKLREEVEEYIVTGGFPKGDPRARRVEHGIHEAFVGLLKAIAAELGKSGGSELPASWISGYYGSGKSSFAKLLGMALDGTELDDGTSLAEALLRRDDSPRRQELVDAWKRILELVEPIAVVFDVGAVARDNEHIHSAALRQIQRRLGYSKSNLVAQWELKLERDGVWQEFLEVAASTLGTPWREAKEQEQAEDHFSHVLHVMQPERYPSPMEWLDSHAGTGGLVGSAPQETIEAIEAMLKLRAVGRTLFLVIDEVSQYVHQDDTRMLRLQSFVSELGKRLKGAAWLLATGQQKLEETSESVHIGKLKDRFPPALRVHLASTNIRDVVHKRLLKKKAEHEAHLRELFQTHRADLKLHGYSCEEITEEDFVEVYPMLPGHVDLLLQITSNLRDRSTRTQRDAHAIRGLLQLLGELFRDQKLAEREVGELVTLDAIYQAQHTDLDPDVQTAMARISSHHKLADDEIAQRAARAVALLELISEHMPTTAELVAKCLYSHLGQGNQLQAVSEALERLREENLLGFSESQGYKVQSSAGQEWERERRDVPVTGDRKSELVQEKLHELISMPERPRWKGFPFPWTAWYSDGRSAEDKRIKETRSGATVVVDFRFLANRADRATSIWVQRSDQAPLQDRIVWVVGDPGRIGEIARDLSQSRYMITRYQVRRDSLSREKKRLLIEEESRIDGLESRLRDAVAEAFFDGTLYFRGGSKRPADFGSSFATALTEAAKRWLPDLFPYFTEIAITDSELNQLLEPQLSGPSTKFMEKGLGILSLDAGRYIASCSGAVPSKIMSYLEQEGTSGNTLLQHFSRPPYGYSSDVVIACLVGLLRASKIRVRPEQGPEITSVRDPGAKDLFRKVKEGLGRAGLFPVGEAPVGPRDRIAICKLFEDQLGVPLDRENDAIADAVFQQFPGRREALREVESLLQRLPGRPEPPSALSRLGRALEGCMRTRQVEEIVIAVKHHLDALRDGFEQLGIYRSELSEEAIQAVVRAADVRDHQLRQLEARQQLGDAATAAEAICTHLDSERPWRDIQSLTPALDTIRERYREERRSLISAQAEQAEEAQGRLKIRAGFEKLDADQAHRVLRVISEAVVDTTEDAVHPTLAALAEGFRARLAEAEARAHDLLDELLDTLTEKPVIKVKANLRGRELSSRGQLQSLLDELEERIGPHVDQGKRVRII